MAEAMREEEKRVRISDVTTVGVSEADLRALRLAYRRGTQGYKFNAEDFRRAYDAFLDLLIDEAILNGIRCGEFCIRIDGDDFQVKRWHDPDVN